MFEKEFKVKSNTQLKTSDKKKLRLTFSRSFPGFAEEDIHSLIPLKDDVSVSKVQTHKGDISYIYFVNREPLAYSITTVKGEVYLPTVYLCWRYPHISLATIFPTQKDVLRHLQRGSDLMMPGVIYKGELTMYTFGTFENGSPAAVSVNGNIIAIGVTAYSSTDMYMAGGRGKAVLVSHVFGDHLWGQGTKIALPGRQPSLESAATPDSIDSGGSAFLPTHYVIVGDNSNDNSIGGMSNSNTQGSTSNGAISNSNTAATSNSNMEGSGSVSYTDDDLSYCTSTDCTSETTELEEPLNALKMQAHQNSLSAPPEVLNSNPMDSLLLHCFLKAIVQSKKKLPLPILCSTFYANHVRAAIPDDQTLEVKKTSYKKFSKFLEAMEEENILVVRQEAKGVEKIVVVNFEHPRVTSFRYNKAETSVKANPSSESQFVPPTFDVVYVVSGDTHEFFRTCAKPKGTVMDTKEIRDAVTNFVKRHKYINPTTKHVILEPPLSGAVTKPKEGLIRELPWNDVMNRLIGRMNPAVRISRPGFETQIKKGKITPIEMSVAKRSGNKIVTQVYNLSSFGIDEQELSHKLNKMAAASSTVMSTVNRTPTSMMVQVQGNATAECADLLLKLLLLFVFGESKDVISMGQLEENFKSLVDAILNCYCDVRVERRFLL